MRTTTAASRTALAYSFLKVSSSPGVTGGALSTSSVVRPPARSRIVVHTRVGFEPWTKRCGRPSSWTWRVTLCPGTPPDDGQRQALPAEAVGSQAGVEDLARRAPVGFPRSVDLAQLQLVEDEHLLPGWAQACSDDHSIDSRTRVNSSRGTSLGFAFMLFPYELATMAES